MKDEFPVIDDAYRKAQSARIYQELLETSRDNQQYRWAEVARRGYIEDGDDCDYRDYDRDEDFDCEGEE